MSRHLLGNFLTTIRARRRQRAREFRKELSRHRAGVIASMRAVLRPLSGRPALWELWPTAATADEAGDQPLHLQVLQIVRNHPEGIDARDVGNQLGIDWRAVPAIARTLIYAGLVEEVAHEFYPAREASRR